MRAVFRVLIFFMIIVTSLNARLYMIDSKKYATAELASSHPLHGDLYMSLSKFKGYVNINDNKEIADFALDVRLENISSRRVKGAQQTKNDNEDSDAYQLFKNAGRYIKLRFKEYYPTTAKKGVAVIATSIGSDTKDIKYYVSYVKEFDSDKEAVVMEAKVVLRDFPKLRKNITDKKLKIGSYLNFKINFPEAD